jgi:hypothetical protein
VFAQKKLAAMTFEVTHVLWGRTGTNPRMESFKEYLVSLNLHILSQGKKPTFVVRNRKKVAVLTLATNKIGNLVTVMYLMSHFCQTSYIRFQIGNTAIS